MQLQNEISVLKSQNSVMENDVAELNEILRSQNRELDALNMDVARKNAEINRLTPKAENYQEICSKMKIGNIGYASSNFHSDKSIIVVQKALWLQDGITLTANWPQGGTVNVSYSSDCARFSFTEDSWYQTTKLKVYPKSLGVTVATFGNSVNKEAFKVLVIVID